jgi:hypothetical protein
MAFGSKLGFLSLLAGIAAFGSAADFSGSSRVMDVMRAHLDRAQACFESGNLDAALAYTDAVIMDRPERIFIDTSGTCKKQKSVAEQAWREAVQIWQDSLPCAINVVYVDSAEKADVVINFNPDVVSEGMNVAGNIQWRRAVEADVKGQLQSTVTATIKVRTSDPSGRKAMSLELMRHTCAHEIGHLLGLADSYRSGGIMGPLDLQAPATKLSDDELTAMRNMRDEARKLRFLASLASIRR